MPMLWLKKKATIGKVVAVSSIIFLWAVLTLSLLLYHIPMQHEDGQSKLAKPTASPNMTKCSNPILYNSDSGICKEALQQSFWSHDCPQDSLLYVMQDNEQQVRLILNGLEHFFKPSPECTEKAIPFICLYLFGLCQGELFIQPTAEECLEVQSSVCHQEWNTLKELFEDFLPDCDIFPKERVLCANESREKGGVNRSNSSDIDVEDKECNQDFFRPNGSDICVPNCYSWLQTKKGVSIAIDVLVISFSLIGFLSSLVLITVSFCRHNVMLHYPSVLIIYMNLDILILIFLVMIPYATEKKIVCSSKDLIESVIHVTPFCIVSGMLSTYVIFQLPLWWFLHMTVLFYSIKYPFRAQKIKKGMKRRVLHVVSLLIGLLLPVVPVIASTAEFAATTRRESANSETSSPWSIRRGYGFGVATYPSIICTAINRDVIYYVTILPIGIVLGLGGSLLIISMWLIHQKSQGTKKHFGKAEKKLLLIFAYYLVLTIVSQITIVTRLIDIPKFRSSLQDYLLCEQNGHNPSSPCSRADVERYGNPLIPLVPFLAIEILPAVLLIFVVNAANIKNIISTKRQSRRVLTTNSTNTSFDLKDVQ